MTDENPTCPNCGSPLPPDTSPADCPKCLINNAAWSQTHATPDSFAPTIPGTSTASLPPALPDLPDLGTDFGGYKINHLLGRGGMGAVYEAEHVETGRRVALKVLSHTFSSPEQLRGDELNARSDMYSVGATLYYLLTGHAPFEEGNMIKLLSRVLEENPPNPRTLRPEIPKTLARVILHCLAKTPTDRFKSYAELAKALQPYSSESPNPGTLALRFGAYMIDTVIFTIFGFFYQWAIWGRVGDIINPQQIGTPKSMFIALSLNLLMATYFGLTEGRSGATLGKQLLRLRLVRSDGGTAGFTMAFLRATILLAITSLPYWGFVFINPAALKGEAGPLGQLVLGLANIGIFAAVFILARRRNGYSGLHGLATRTRVVRLPKAEKRPRLAIGVPTSLSDPFEGAERVGPYDVIEPLGSSSAGNWFLAYDTKLLRRVWVNAVPAGTPDIPQTQRNLNRPGRLRWITGRRSPDENWDAYEAPNGTPLPDLLDTPQPWSAVRFWLLDLAEELNASTADGTTPTTLAFDRVWITADGRAKLLDFPAPGTSSENPPQPSTDPAAFIYRIARAAVPVADPPAPVHAQKLLAPDQPATTGDLVATLNDSIRRPAAISRRRRLAITFATSAFPLIALLLGSMFILLNLSAQKSHPDLVDLCSVTTAIQFSDNPAEKEDLRRYIAHRFAGLVNDPTTWVDLEAALLVDPTRRAIAASAVADYPELTAAELTAAEAAAAPAIEKKIGVIHDLPPAAPLGFFLGAWFFYSGLPALFMSLAFRRGLVLMMFGATVATKTGQPASRLHCLWRGIITSSPFVVLGAAAIVLLAPEGRTPAETYTLTAIVITIVVTLTIISHLRKTRSLQDLLARTWLVPK